jgi:GAF domain-containing protein
LPALRLAESDRHHGNLGTEGRRLVAAGALTVVRELLAHETNAKAGGSPTALTWPGTPVLCIAGRGEHDGAAAAMLAQLLDQRGIGSRTLPASAITPDAIGALEFAGVEVVVISYLNPAPQPFARYVCRRLRRSAPHLKLVVACWNLPPEAGSLEALASTVGADAIVASIGSAIRHIETVASGAVTCAPVLAPIPVQEEARLAALHASGLLTARSEGHFDRVARKLASAFETPIALVTLVDESCQIWKGLTGLPEELEKARQAPRETSICGHVVAIDAPLVVEDTARDPRFASNSFLRENGIRFYAGAPLRTACGHVIGSLCVIDTRPRTISGRDIKLLQVIADGLMSENLGRDSLRLSGEPHIAEGLASNGAH